MLSIPGSSLRLSWAISNSYSKSEIARRPLTIALRLDSRANSTSRLEKICTSTLARSAVASSMKALRSSAVNRVFSLRIGLLTTPTTTRSKTSEVRVMMSRWPLVTGS